MKSINTNTDLIKSLRSEELSALKLRALYELNGYSGYRMSKFEEYEFYIRNKDFLVSENVLTFTDVNGKLMALKPDVTLSIIRHMKDEPNKIRKVFYDENVYRVSGNSRAFREIKQAGVECIGAVTETEVCEVLALAAESLRVLSGGRRAALNIAHLGFIDDLIKDKSSAARAEIIKYISEKNIDGIMKLDGGDAIAPLMKLSFLNASFQDITGELKKLFANNSRCEKYINQLENIIYFFKNLKNKNLKNENKDLLSMLRIDFSVVSDLNYYNGIAFHGFIEGVPARILSGGQYDRLMRKMGHKSGAVGFAVYLDMLGRCNA